MQIVEHCTMAFDLKEMVAARLGENYQLHERHINRTLVAAQRVIGFDKVYARAEGAYLYDMDNQPYLDFLSGYSVFNIGRNHPVVKQSMRWIDNYARAMWRHSSSRQCRAKGANHRRQISLLARRNFVASTGRSLFPTKCRPGSVAREKCLGSSIGIWSRTSLRWQKH